MVPTVVAFAFKSCSVVPFAKRDHGTEAMKMVPAVVTFALFSFHKRSLKRLGSCVMLLG